MHQKDENGIGKDEGTVKIKVTKKLIVLILIAAAAILTYLYFVNKTYTEDLKYDLEKITVFIQFCEQYNVTAAEPQNGMKMYAVAGINVSVARMDSWLEGCCVLRFNETDAIVGFCPKGTPCYEKPCRLTVGE